MRIFEEVAKVAGVKSERSRMIANARYHWGSWDSCTIGINMFLLIAVHSWYLPRWHRPMHTYKNSSYAWWRLLANSQLQP